MKLHSFNNLTTFLLTIFVVQATLSLSTEGSNEEIQRRIKRDYNISNSVCQLPELPSNGSYSIGGSQIPPTPGWFVDEWNVLHFTCDSNYDLIGVEVSVCKNGQWFPWLPYCNASAEKALPTDCSQIENLRSGVYKIQPEGASHPFDVSCYLDEEQNIWTYMQHRFDGSIHFYRNYEEYRIGFGDLTKEHWLGLEHIYQITKGGNYELLVELKDFENVSKYVSYKSFSLTSGADGYRLQLEGFSSDIGDSLLFHHNGRRFSTADHDGNEFVNLKCSESYQSGWWFHKACFSSNLNGVYRHKIETGYSYTGIIWNGWRGPNNSLKETKMLIKPNLKDTPRVRYPADCSEVRGNISGVYEIKPGASPKSFSVFCDLNFNNQKWTVIQRRFDGNINFTKNYGDYKNGFGYLCAEHWLGLEKIYQLTKSHDYELYVELTDFENIKRYARYGTFSLSEESESYQMKVDEYTGNAGDSLKFHNGKKFSAPDLSTAAHVECTTAYKSSWWFGETCFDGNLNGIYRQKEEKGYGYVGIIWNGWRSLENSLKATKMLIKKKFKQ